MFKTAWVGILLSAAVLAHEYGPQERVTGAPGDDPMSCATSTCHTSLRQGGPLNPAGGGVTAIFSSGSSYTPGGPAITITVSVTDPRNTHYGFQMTARRESDLTNGQAGTFTTGGNNQLVICDNGSPRVGSACPANAAVEFIEHAYPTNAQVGTTPYTFTWKPPATDVGPVHFYLAGNSVNGDLKADGNDHVYTASYVLKPAVACTSSATPSIAKVISAGGFGALPTFASGSWIEIYGSNLAGNTTQWSGTDFNGVNAPTSLSNVSVSVNGKPAYVYFLSSGQVNVQAPADSATGTQQVTLTSCGSTSTGFPVQRDPLAPGMLAPPNFLVGGKQYLVALFPDSTYVGNPNLIAGVPFRPAKPGELITTYGIGFGDAKKNSDGSIIPPGVIVNDLNTLANSLKISFGSTPASVSYSGLSPGYVGLYQFNIAVPDVPDGDTPINITLNGTPLQQTLYLTVHR